MPVVAFVPDHAPEAVQESASLDDHASNAAAPLGMLVGLALKATIGNESGCGVLCTVTAAV